MDVGTITFSFDVDHKRLMRAVISEDEIGTLMRCHLEAERCARHVLSKLSGGRYNKKNYRFMGSVIEGLNLLGVHENFIVPLKLINDHRNSMSHDRKEDITEKDVTDLKSAVKRLYPKFEESYEVHLEKADKSGFNIIEYKSSSNQKKYAILSIIIIGLLASLPEIANRKLT